MNVVIDQVRRHGPEFVLKWTLLLAAAFSTSAFTYGIGSALIRNL